MSMKHDAFREDQILGAPADNYWPAGMDSLARMIRRDWDQIAYQTWSERYGHDFPVYAVIDGKAVRWEP